MPTSAQLKTLNDTDIRQQTAAGSITPDIVADRLDAIIDHVQGVIQTLTDGSTITMDVADGKLAQVTIAGNRIFAFSNLVAGDAGIIEILQDGSGGHTITWPAEAAEPTGGITLSSGANELTAIGFYYNGTNILLSQESYGVVGGGGGYDADAETFFTAVEGAGGTISDPFKAAWDAFVVSQKDTNGSWSDFKALYPYYGGTLNGARINAKNPGTFDITWANSPTVSATGINFNGTTQYGDTGFIANNSNGITNASGLAIGFYGRENIAGYDMGSYESGKETICIPNADGTYQVYGLGGGFNLASGVERTDKFNYVNKEPGGDLTAYRDGVSVATGPYTLDNTGTFSLYVGAANDTSDVFSSNEHAFGFISTGLTTAKLTKLLSDVNTLMAAISRNV